MVLIHGIATRMNSILIRELLLQRIARTLAEMLSLAKIVCTNFEEDDITQLLKFHLDDLLVTFNTRDLLAELYT